MARDKEKIASRPIPMRRYIWGLAGLWTAIVLVLLVWSVLQEKKDSLEKARLWARTYYDKDLLYRRWNASHGGVYVPVGKNSSPSPYLAQIPERDVRTPSGRLLTLVNPAYMIRQVNALAQDPYQAKGHLTSLKPLRPENRADAWETSALEAFVKGQSEVSSVEKIKGQSYLRLMRPLIAKPECLSCHGAQGYKVGEVLGRPQRHGAPGVALHHPGAPRH